MTNPHVEAINALADQILQEAQSNAIDILNKYKFKNGAKKVRLIQDINKARRASEVCRIMYYTVLAGEGLSVIGGAWQKEYA